MDDGCLGRSFPNCGEYWGRQVELLLISDVISCGSNMDAYRLSDLVFPCM